MEVVLAWPNANQCDDEDWGCVPPALSMTILGVACHGCDVLDDPTGKTAPAWAVFRAVARTVGPITIDASLRFDDTGDERQVSGSTTGDREVAVEAECQVIDSDALAPSRLNLYPPARKLFHPCGATRQPTETAVIFPVIRTLRGDTRFPFCIYSGSCQRYGGMELRPLSSLSITPAPRTWAHTEANSDDVFAVLPALAPEPSASINAVLAHGEIATTSVAIPPAR